MLGVRRLIGLALMAMAIDAPNAAVGYFREAFGRHPLRAALCLRLECRNQPEWIHTLATAIVRGPALGGPLEELLRAVPLEI